MLNRKIFVFVQIYIYKNYESSDFIKIYEVLSTLKYEKLKINNILIEKYKDMNEKPNFQQDHYSITSTGI